MSVDTRMARELADLLEPPFDLRDISLHDMRQASEQLRALVDEVERQARVIVETGISALELHDKVEPLLMAAIEEHNTIWLPLLEAAEGLVKRNDEDCYDIIVNDWKLNALEKLEEHIRAARDMSGEFKKSTDAWKKVWVELIGDE